AVVAGDGQAIRDALRVTVTARDIAIELHFVGERDQFVVREVRVVEAPEIDIPLDERDRYAVGQRMVGRLARLGPIFLRVFADDVHGRVEGVHVDRLHL